jgi:hypothetical protein
MSRAGCALTSLATIAGIYGKETTPLEMRNLFLALPATPGPAIDANNNTTIARLSLTVDGKTLQRSATLGGDFDDIAAELRAGRPLLLAVPNKVSTAVGTIVDLSSGVPMTLELQLTNGNLRANDKRHYIVAYGLNPSLGPTDPVTAADIFISDPAYSVGYRTRYGNSYSAGEELVNPTLQDYFDIINNNTTYSFDAEDWFDNSTFTRLSDSRTVQVRGAGDAGGNDRLRQIQRFTITGGTAPPAGFANPIVEVDAPVELRITIGGITYASSPGVAQAGDLLLTRAGADLVAEFDEATQTGVGDTEPVELFPAYSLLLPPEVAGLGMDFQIHGVGNGDYTIGLFPGVDGYVATNFLQGTISNGAVLSGSIGVIVPEPAAASLLAAGVILVARRKKRTGDLLPPAFAHQAADDGAERESRK